MAVDASGKVWPTADILLSSTLVSVLGMGSLAMLAWRKSQVVEDRKSARSLILR
jgi:hypothetical protein